MYLGKGMMGIPDISSPMTLNLRNVSQSTYRESEELPPEGTSNGFADGCLAYTWRTSEANDLAFHTPAQLAHSQKL